MTDVMIPPPPPVPPPDTDPTSTAGPAGGGGVRALWLVFAGLLVVGALTFGAYQVVTLLSHEERTEVTTHPAAGLTTIDVRSGAGSVRIAGSDGDEVVVRAEISDGLRATAESQQVVGDELQLRASCPNFGSDFCRVTYEIEVPRDLAVVVRADDGSVRVADTAGVVDVDADNGSVEIARLSGTVRAATDNGRVEGVDLRSASVTADSDNGSVTLQFAIAPTAVTATTENGSVEVVVPDDGEAYRVDVQSDNGDETDDVLEDPASPRSLTLRTDNGSATARTAP